MKNHLLIIWLFIVTNSAFCCSAPVPGNKALLDTTFINGSQISRNDIGTEDYDNLALICKLWGFVKYYHPEIAKGDMNWDFELFRFLPGLLKASSKEERNKLIEQWIIKTGNIEGLNESPVNSGDKLKFDVDLVWLEDKEELGEEITSMLQQIKNANRTDVHFYYSFSPPGNPLFQNEEAYKNMTYPDAGFRLLALFRYWNIIEYFYPYRNMIEGDWDVTLKEFIPVFADAANEKEYNHAILNLAAKINDTHASTYGSKYLEDYYGKYYFPFMISFVEEKCIVTKIFTDSANGIKTGDIITAINGKKIEELVEEKLPVTAASNYTTKMRNICLRIRSTNDSTAFITYTNDAGENTIKIRCPVGKELSNIAGMKNEPFRKLDDSIGYIYPGTMKIADVGEAIKNLKDCKGIVIDFRSYPNEFILFALGGNLISAPVPFVKFTRTSYQLPGRFVFGTQLNIGNYNNEIYKGKIVILINEKTQSSAEYHTMAFRKAPGAVVIGSQTAGADGNVSYFTLPGGINTVFTGIGVYYPDGTETQGIGIVPDIEIKPTIKGIKEERDEILEKAVEVINLTDHS